MNSEVSPTPLAYSAAQLAELLAVSLRHIRRLDNAGQLPKAIKLGRLKRYAAEAIEEWLRSGGLSLAKRM